MDFEQAKKDVMTWVIDFVERPNKGLNGWPPCPHARRARLENQFEIRPGRIDPFTDLRQVELKDKLVLAYVYDPDKFSADEFNQQISAVNSGFLVPRNMIALADHPQDIEDINGVIMNQGRWAIAFVQPLDKLDKFAKVIADRGYYHGWPEHYLTALFEHRQDPRK